MDKEEKNTIVCNSNKNRCTPANTRVTAILFSLNCQRLDIFFSIIQIFVFSVFPVFKLHVLSTGNIIYLENFFEKNFLFSTNNLDIYHATNMMKIVRRLCDELGKTVILVLHEINYAAFYSDYICAFKDGKIARFGTVEEVMTKENLSQIYQVDFEILTIAGKPLSIYY